MPRVSLNSFHGAFLVLLKEKAFNMKDQTNILYIPSTVDQSRVDDKMAYFINYLYTYPFKYKERIKLQVSAKKKKNLKVGLERGAGWGDQLELVEYISEACSVSFPVSAGGYSYVVTSSADTGAGGYSNVVTSEFSNSNPQLYEFSSDDYLIFWDGFVPVFSQKMREIITTNDYTKVRDKLIELGIMQCNWSYSNFEGNEKPMEYALIPIHRYSEPTIYQMTNIRFINKLDNLNNSRRRSLSPLLQILEDKLFEIDFDYSAGWDYVTNKTFISKKTKKPSIAAKASRKMGLQIMKDKSPHDFYLREGQKVKRVFSPYTSLSRDLRPYLSFQGQNLFDIDISCALPTLFNIYLDHKSEDEKLYQYLTSSSSDGCDLYKYLGELWGEDDRDNVVKPLTMVLFFGKETTIRLYRNKFENDFPTVYATMANLKKNNYKILATKLMQLERKIMIDTVSDGLLKENKMMPLLTIHDGILTTEEYAEKTRSRIQKEIKDMIGIIPKVKIEPLII